MKFFIDTASLSEIREAASMGILDGVTTNPSLVSKEGKVDFHEHVRAICEIVNGPVSAEVTEMTVEFIGMIHHRQASVRLRPSACRNTARESAAMMGWSNTIRPRKMKAGR